MGTLQEKIDRAAEMKRIEESANMERKALEAEIWSELATDSTVKAAGSFYVATITPKNTEKWDGPTCVKIAASVGADTFAGLFKVEFTGKKRELQKFMAASNDADLKGLINSALSSKPGRPSFSYAAVEV